MPTTYPEPPSPGTWPPTASGPLAGATAGNDVLVGTANADTINGLAGNDTLTGNGGNDIIDGGTGIDIDTAKYSGSRLNYTISKTGSTYTVAAKTGTDGTDTVTNVERLTFADVSVAVDLDGNAGQVAKILGAVFGSSYVQNKEYVGIGLSYIDGGMAYEALCALAVGVTGKTGHGDVVELLWNNVIGTPIPAGDRAYFVELLDNGMSVGALTAMAADTSFNIDRIGLIGLTQAGIEYMLVG